MELRAHQAHKLADQPERAAPRVVNVPLGRLPIYTITEQRQLGTASELMVSIAPYAVQLILSPANAAQQPQHLLMAQQAMEAPPSVPREHQALIISFSQQPEILSPGHAPEIPILALAGLVRVLLRHLLLNAAAPPIHALVVCWDLHLVGRLPIVQAAIFTTLGSVKAPMVATCIA